MYVQQQCSSTSYSHIAYILDDFNLHVIYNSPTLFQINIHNFYDVLFIYIITAHCQPERMQSNLYLYMVLVLGIGIAYNFLCFSHWLWREFHWKSKRQKEKVNTAVWCKRNEKETINGTWVTHTWWWALKYTIVVL